MFSNASNFVKGVDNVFLVIIGICLFFLVLITGIMVLFLIRYNKKRHAQPVQVQDNPRLEITWTVIPVLLVLFMFYIGWKQFLPMRDSPANAMRVKVVAQMWAWSFEYPGRKVADTLVLPINKPVHLGLHSRDVIHGFYIPSFRVKEDAVPGQNNYTWFIPGELGDYDIFCSLYCGVSHAYMHAIVRIVDEQAFGKWLAALPAKKMDNDNLGFKVLEKNGCLGCHSLDGKKLVGPSFKGLYGSMVEVVTNGANRKIAADSLYVSTAILDPDKDLVSGFPPGVMKSYKGLVKDAEVGQIIEYLETLK
ncbi:MAG TPA: cytochrome c oxidase subunit II [Paludibacter sp.]|nr:cytochrome c oxidase subunit II [Paludibacter sp.]